MDKQFMNKPLDMWPRLTESLPFTRDPLTCQGCGVKGITELPKLEGPEPPLYRWREHDMLDRPENRVVILCKKCEDALIEKHNRLYARIEIYTPEPGTMHICADCPQRSGLDCKSPLARRNGGEGMEIIIPQPHRVHLLRSPRRLSGWTMIYPGPARACQGKGFGEQEDTENKP